MHRLTPLFQFSSVAVIGATDSTRMGAGPWRALSDLGYTGRFYPINPRRAEVHGLPAYPDLASVPEPVEAAVIAVARASAPAALRACAAKGVRAVTAIGGGYAETDDEGRALQAELAAIAREHDLLFVGPNCFGVASPANRCAIYAGPGLDQAHAGNVGVISNSGGFLPELIEYGTPKGLGFSHFVSCGNETRVTASDVLDYYIDDPATDVVLAILESVRDPSLFRAAAERALAARKPIVVLKLGVSPKGARAAFTHTAALAGDAAAYEALFRQYGIIRVDDLDDLIEMGALLSRAVGHLRARPLERAGVIDISGGGKELICDRAAAAGVELPELSAAAAAAIQAVLPAEVHASNPLDTTGNWQSPWIDALYPVVLRALADEPGIDMIVSRFGVPTQGDLGVIRQRLDTLLEARAARPDPLYVVLSRTANQFSAEWTAAIWEHDLPAVQGYGRGLRALGRLAAYSRHLRARASAAAATAPAAGAVQLPADAAPAGRTLLNEVEAKDLLRAAGLPVMATTWARSANEAVSQAAAHGYPVVLKAISPQVVHKSDVGAVRLGLADGAAVARAFDELRAVVTALPGAEFQGVAVQPQATPGVELVLGAQRDPQLGPLVLCGLGGVFVEVLGDVALRLAPLTPFDAQQMLTELRGATLLDGARGAPPVDRGAVVNALLRLSALLLAVPTIASVDLNPVFATADGLLAVDARVALQAEGQQ